MRKFLLLVLMLAVVVGTQFMIGQQQADVVLTHEQLAGNPVDRYAAVGSPQGTVLVAHGFAGSKELMQYWGFALARQGFDTYLFDQPGHGEQVQPLPEWRSLANNPLGRNLQAMIAELTATGRAEAGRIALVGHSMGGAAVVAAAMEQNPAIVATVAISAAYSDPLPPDLPVNLLSLVAERDPASIRAAAAALEPQSATRKTVDFPGKNHLTIIYDPQAFDQAIGWIHQAMGTRPVPIAPVAPWGWILAALAGGLGTVLSVAALLAPPESRAKTGRQPSLGFLTGLVALSVAALSAVLATVYLRVSWVGVAVLDYLLPYFAIMALVLWLLRFLWPRDFAFPLTQGGDGVAGATLRGLGVTLAYLGALVPVIQMNLTHHMPTLPRIMPLLISAVVLWLYFVQEEGLKRAVAHQHGVVAGLGLGLISKLVIVGTWLGATALPNPPIFLTLTIPITVVVLVVLELIATFMGVQRFSSAAAATVNAVVLAWAVAVTFPLQ